MTPEQEKGIMQAFDAYCKTVLRNKARNLHKEAARQERFETSLDELPPEVEKTMQHWDYYDFSQAIPLGGPGEEMRIVDPALATAILRVLPRFREVLFLAYFLEYNDKEIGEKLDRSTSTITSQRNNTLEKLYEILGENHAV